VWLTRVAPALTEHCARLTRELQQGLFSGNASNKFQVDKEGLKALTVEKLTTSLQSKPGNEMAGLQGRTDMLVRLASALNDKDDFFGFDGRPGNLVGEFLLP
jgi:hypothetical protein